MKFVVWVISALNVYLGLRCFLNAIHVLQMSKYSQMTTVLFAILFLGLGAMGFYVTIAMHKPGLGLLVSVGPWLLAIVIMFIALVTGKP